MPCSKPVPNIPASVPLAQTVNNNSVLFSIYPDDISRPGYGDIAFLDREMKAALVSGISQPNTIATLPTVCDTGNCTFTTGRNLSYSTLGASSRCIDVSSKIIQLDYNSTNFNYTEYRLPGGLSVTYCDGCYVMTEVTLPNGTRTFVEIPGTWSTLFNATVDQSDQEHQDYKDISIAGVNISNAGAGFLPSFGRVTMMMPTNRRCQSIRQQNDINPQPSCDQPTLNITSLPEDFGLLAAVCWLYPSIIDFWGEIVNGQLIETQVAEPTPLALSSPDDMASLAQAWVYKFQDPCYINGSLYDIANRNSWPDKAAETIDITDMLSNATATGPRKCLYGLGSEYHLGMFQLFQQVFTEDQCVPTVNYETIMCESWWLGSFWNGRNATLGSINSVMEGAAKALTNRIRTIGEDFDHISTKADGMAMQTYVCTSFSWPWLLFPAAILLGTTTLLIATLVKGFTEGSNSPSWKSSLLPLLFYGLDERSKCENLMESAQLNELAKGAEVSFRSAVEGPRFVPGNVDRESSSTKLAIQD